MATDEKQSGFNPTNPMQESAPKHTLTVEVSLLTQSTFNSETLLQARGAQVEFFQRQKYLLVGCTMQAMFTLAAILYQAYILRHFIHNPWGQEVDDPLTNLERRNYVITWVSISGSSACMTTSGALTVRKILRLLRATEDTCSRRDKDHKESLGINMSMIISALVMFVATTLEDVLQTYLGDD